MSYDDVFSTRKSSLFTYIDNCFPPQVDNIKATKGHWDITALPTHPFSLPKYGAVQRKQIPFDSDMQADVDREWGLEIRSRRQTHIPFLRFLFPIEFDHSSLK